MIKSHGTADNFNTELPEQLHINVAKDPFNHSNKKNYIAQMCLQLQRQEAVHKFMAYPVWSVEGYCPGSTKRQKAQNVSMDLGVGEQALEDGNDNNNNTSGPTAANSPNTTSVQHYIAKNPPFTMPLGTIKEKFGIHQFDKALQKFLHQSKSLHPSLHHAITNAEYPIFHQFTARIPSPPQVASEPFIHDVICAAAGKFGTTVLAKPSWSIDDETTIKWWDIKGKLEGGSI